MLAARHNVESPVVSPQRAVDRGEASIAAAWRSRAEAAERDAYELQAQVEQLRAAGVGTPSSAVAQDVVVRMRARAWHHLQRAVLGWRKRSLLQACAMWRALTMTLMAGTALLTCRAEVAAAQRGATRGVQSAEAHARARCDALQREVDRLRGQLAAAARKAQVARDEAAAAHDDAEQARETRRRGDLVARSQKAQGEEAQRQVRASTNALRRQQHITHLLRRGTVGLALAAAVTRGQELAAAAALAKWRRSVLLLQLGLAR